MSFEVSVSTARRAWNIIQDNGYENCFNRVGSNGYEINMDFEWSDPAEIQETESEIVGELIRFGVEVLSHNEEKVDDHFDYVMCEEEAGAVEAMREEAEELNEDLDNLRMSINRMRREREDIYRDMEVDPLVESEGGPVADYYGGRLDELDRHIGNKEHEISVVESLIRKLELDMWRVEVGFDNHIQL